MKCYQYNNNLEKKRGFGNLDKRPGVVHKEFDNFVPKYGSSIVRIKDIDGIIEAEKNKFLDLELIEDDIEIDVCEDVVIDGGVTDRSDNENESDDGESFSSTVSYSYTFPEVAFLMYKIYKMLKVKFRLDLRKKVDVIVPKETPVIEEITTETSEEDAKEEKKLALKSALEKLSMMQDLQLKVARNKSSMNKKKWRGLLQKFVEKERKPLPRNEAIEKIRKKFLAEVDTFMFDEMTDFNKVYGSVWMKKIKHKKDFKIKEDTIETKQASNIKEKVGTKSKTLLDVISKATDKCKKLPKEEVAFKMKKKDALVILKVRDENILKTRVGGEYLIDNYFIKIHDLAKKRVALSRRKNTEEMEWNELKIRNEIRTSHEAYQYFCKKFMKHWNI